MKRWTLAVVFLAFGALLGTVLTASVLKGNQQAPALGPVEAGSYRDVAKKVLPAVVSIEAKVKPVQKARKPGTAPMYVDPSELDPNPSGSGSGVLIDPKGWIVTCYHVVDGAETIDVYLTDGRKFAAREVKVDPKTDLALIKIEAKEDLPYLAFGDSDKMEIGDRVLAAGAPFGLSGSVSQGIISGKGRSLKMNMYEDFLQTDAAINPGNSGGPLVSMEGKLIGINAAIKSRSGGWQGVGLAVSGNLVKQIVEQLQKDGTVKRGYLGVQAKDVSDNELLARLGLKEGEGGVLVSAVFEGTPADKAGIKEGDLLTHLGDKPVRDSRELQRVVLSLPLNKESEVKLMRDGKATTLKVTIEEQPEKFGTSRAPALIVPDKVKGAVTLDAVGFDVADVTPELIELYGLREGTRGAVVVGVTRDGLAAVAGVRPGTIIVKVGDTNVNTAADVKAALEKTALEKGVLVQGRSTQGGTSYFLLRAKQ